MKCGVRGLRSRESYLVHRQEPLAHADRPFLGEAAAVVLGVTQITRLGTVAGVAGNTAFGIQTIVVNAEIAPLAIPGKLLVKTKVTGEF